MATDAVVSAYFENAMAAGDPKSLAAALEHPESPAFFTECILGDNLRGAKRRRVLDYALSLPSKRRTVQAVAESFSSRGMFSLTFVTDRIGATSAKQQKETLSMCLSFSPLALKDLLEKVNLAEHGILGPKVVDVANYFMQKEKAKCTLNINRSSFFSGGFAEQLRKELMAMGVTFVDAGASISEDEKWSDALPDVDSEVIKSCWRSVYERLHSGMVAITPAYSLSLQESRIAQFVMREGDVSRRLRLAASCAQVVVFAHGARFASEISRFDYVDMFKDPEKLASVFGVARITLVPAPVPQHALLEESPIAYVVSAGVVIPRGLAGVFQLGRCALLEEIAERLRCARSLPKQKLILLVGADAHRWGPLILREQEEATRFQLRTSLAREGHSVVALPAEELLDAEIGEAERREVEKRLGNHFGDDAASLWKACFCAADRLSKAGMAPGAFAKVFDAAQDAQGASRRSKVRTHRQRVSTREDEAGIDLDDLGDLEENVKKFTATATSNFVISSAIAQGVPESIAKTIAGIKPGTLTHASTISTFIANLKGVVSRRLPPLSDPSIRACLASWAPDWVKRGTVKPEDFLVKVSHCLVDCVAAGNFVKDLGDEELAQAVAKKLTKSGSGGSTTGAPRESLQEWLNKIKLREVGPGDNRSLQRWVSSEGKRKNLVQALGVGAD